MKYAKVASSALKVASVAGKQLIENGKITSWTSLASAAVSGYLETSKAGEIGALAKANKVSAEAIKNGLGTTYALSETLQTINSIQTTVAYITPWVGLAETYIRNDGELTPGDWISAVGDTLSTGVSGAVGDVFGGSGFGARVGNAAVRTGINAAIGGALSLVDRDAALDWAYNSVGNEIGQYIGQEVGSAANGYLVRLAASIDERNSAKGSAAAPGGQGSASVSAAAAGAQEAQQAPQLQAPTTTDHLAKEGRSVGQGTAGQPEPYTVQRGDNLSEIVARTYGVGFDEELILKIASLNGLKDPGSIMPGQELILPPMGSDQLASAPIDTTLRNELRASYGGGDSGGFELNVDQLAARFGGSLLGPALAENMASAQAGKTQGYYGDAELPPLSGPDNTFHHLDEGVLYSNYSSAINEAANENNSILDRIVFGGLAIAAAPLAGLEEMARGLYNTPYTFVNASQSVGEHSARAAIYSERGQTDDAIMEGLHVLRDFALAFDAGGTVGVPVAGALESVAARSAVGPLAGSTESLATRRAYLNEKFGRTGDLHLDINTRGRQELASNYYLEQGWPSKRIESHLSGIDFTQDVGRFTLSPNTRVGQWQVPGNGVGNYFAPLGTEASQLGINPAGRELIVYSPSQRTEVLRSTAAEVIDTWTAPGTSYKTQGGGTQYFTGQPGLFNLVK